MGCDGHRHIAGVELANRKRRGGRRDFLVRLRERDLHGVECLAGDDRHRLRGAIRKVFNEAAVPYAAGTAQDPRPHPAKAEDDCLLGDCVSYPTVPRGRKRADLAAGLGRWQTVYPKLTDWVEDRIEEP